MVWRRSLSLVGSFEQKFEHKKTDHCFTGFLLKKILRYGNLEQLQKPDLFRVSDCSVKPAKTEAVGAQGAAVRPEEAPGRDHEPQGKRLRTWSGKRDGEAGTPK